MESGIVSKTQLKELARFLNEGSCKSLVNSSKFEKEVLERIEEGHIHAAGGFQVIESYDAAGNTKYRAPIHFYVPCYKDYKRFED